MRKIRRRKNYTNYIIIACICIFSVMGIGYGYLQQSLDINLGLSKKTIDITDNVVSSGDGLYVDQYETGRYVYRGSEPNNYIMFNDELWRIIAKEADGTYKIIRDEWLSNRAYDTANNRTTTKNTYCDHPSSGCSVYGRVSGTYTLGNKSGTVTEDSSLAEYLNREYYNSFTSTAKGQIQTHAFNIGGVLELDQSGNDSIAKNLQQEKSYTWTGNIGLLNITDILRTGLDSSCSAVTSCVMPSTINYLLDDMSTNTSFWTMNGWTSESRTSSDGVWTVEKDRGGAFFVGYNAYGTTRSIRPVTYLKSTIAIMSGDGTKSNPYIIS